MNGSAKQPYTSRIKYGIWLGIGFILCLAISSCSRSAWMKSDGREVAPKEQLACAEEVGGATQNQSLDHDELQPKIEECMQAKGYHRRPWWLLNDLHWEVQPLR